MATTKTPTAFDVEVSAHGLGYNKPQQMGNALWLPMFLMAVMAFPVALILSWVRASTIADATTAADVEDAAQLGHWIAAFGFIGFLAVFAAISFAVARILGRFRKGGGDIQEATGSNVQTLKMPKTAKVFMASMMMGMMIIAVAVVLHFIAASNVGTWELESVERWARVLEGFRRLGVGLYLFGIAFGLGTIIQVLRFQSSRIRQLPQGVYEHTRRHYVAGNTGAALRGGSWRATSANSGDAVQFPRTRTNSGGRAASPCGASPRLDSRDRLRGAAASRSSVGSGKDDPRW